MKKNVKLFAMDVDGTLTDGRIYMGNEGELMKAFDVKDGLGIRRLMDAGIIPVIITGRQSKITWNRCKELGIEHVYQGVQNKLLLLNEIAQQQNITLNEIAYMGDDLNDYDLLKAAGQGFVPNDAILELDWEGLIRVSKKGGRGAVREAIEIILSQVRESHG